MRTQNWGIEIEMTGITRATAAKIVAGYFNTRAIHLGGSYDTYVVPDEKERRWKIVSDSSIICQDRNGDSASRLYAVEFVSPICQYDDIERVQELVRALRNGGARVNHKCGIHIHVDASSHNAKTLRNIIQDKINSDNRQIVDKKLYRKIEEKKIAQGLH